MAVETPPRLPTGPANRIDTLMQHIDSPGMVLLLIGLGRQIERQRKEHPRLASSESMRPARAGRERPKRNPPCPSLLLCRGQLFYSSRPKRRGAAKAAVKVGAVFRLEVRREKD